MKTTKKFLSIILAILMIATSVPFAFAADTALAVGDQFEADLTKQGSDNLTFRYVFKVLSLPDAENEYGKLELVRPAEGVYPTVLKIAMLTPKITYDGVTFEITSIGDEAFCCGYSGGPGNELQEVNLMLGTVKNIGYQAFYYCRKLETANLSPYVDKLVIGMEAFDYCDSITSLQIEAVGGGTVEIGQAAFRDLSSLKELNIGYTVSKLGVGAFVDCDALTTLTIDKGALTEIPGWCFSSCEALENIIIPEGITTIGEAAFLDCPSLKNIDFPESLETIYGGVFNACGSLYSISIPANVSYLGSFNDCSIRRIVFEGGEVPELDGAFPIPLLTVEDGYGDGMYASGEEVAITANEKEGYEFVKWEIAEGDGTLADASAAETTYTMGSSTATLRPVYEDIRTECDKGNHEFVNYVKSEEASCGVNAKETAKCENCEVTDTREIEGSALTHSFSKYEEVEAPKCGVAGKEVATCDNGCDATDEKEIPALEHEFNTEDTASAELTRPVKNADGTYTDGYYTFTCQNDNCEETTTVTVKTADYTAFDAAVTQAQELIANTNLCDGPKSGYIARLDAINSRAYSPVRIESEQNEIDGFVVSVNSLIGDIETGIQNGTSIKADFSEMETLFAEISELIGGDTNKIIPNNLSLYTGAQSYYNAVKDNGNYSQNSADSSMPGYISQLETLKAGLIDGTMLKADYTQINAVIAAIDEKLLSTDASHEFMLEFASIKTELDSMKFNPTVSQAAFNECGLLEKAEALNRIIDACADGKHEFATYVKSAEASCGVNAKETAKCENCEVTDTREIEGSALTHSFSKYEEVEAPKCGVAGKEAAACDNNCGTTDEKEIPALEHKDDDGDYKCDYDCSYEFESPCDHMLVLDGDIKTPVICSACGSTIYESDSRWTEDIYETVFEGMVATFKGYNESDTDEIVAYYVVQPSAGEECKLSFDWAINQGFTAYGGFKLHLYHNDNEVITRDFTESANPYKSVLAEKYLYTADGEYQVFKFVFEKTDRGKWSDDGRKAFLCNIKNEIATECDKTGHHEFAAYVKTADASCGVNAKETAKCENCEVTDTREIEGSALTHSFTKYEEIEAPGCGVAGKEAATCDNGCNATDEQVIPALEHKDDDGDNKCDYNCGFAFVLESDGVKTTLDVSKGYIVIADSYVTLDNETVAVDPDGYIITGTTKGDTPLKFNNNSEEAKTFDLVFNNLSLTANTWNSVIVIEDNSPVTLNIVCEGSNAISSYNHPVFNNNKAQTSITINMTITEDSSFTFERRLYQENGILFSKDDTNTFVYINGNQLDAAGQCYVHKNIDGIQDCRGYLCNNCGQYFGEADADNHSFTNYKEVEAPKCGVAGKEVAACDNNCGATDEKEIPALTHEPLDAVVENEVYATCKAEGGYDLVVYCYLCGEEIDSEHITTQKLPHTPSDRWATTETEHYKYCVNDSCDEEIEGTRATHTYTWKVTTEATATTDGVETGTCECGYETTRVIPATGETPDPEPDISDEPEDPSENCEHICHKSGFLGFIWKIVNFFCKLFKINPVCECGAAHY